MKRLLTKPLGRYLAAFFLPVMLYGMVMAVCHIIPFGDRTLLFWDADGQYAAFLAAFRRVLVNGEDFFYSFSRVLGGSMAGLYAYYLASPINLLMALFPETQLPLAFSVIVLVKLGLCGLSFYHYARREHQAGLCGCFFAVGYALMGYTAIYFWDIMWLDAVALLPLLALGLKRLTAGGRPFLYLGALALGLYCNYYIGLMLCLFSVLYCLYQLVLKALTGELTVGEGLRRIGRFALASLLAGGLAAVLLLPAYLALQGGYTIWWNAVLSLGRESAVLDVLTKLYTGAVDFDQLRYGLPNIYIGMPMLVLVGVFLLHPAVPKERRLAWLGLVGVFLLSFCVHFFYMVWHGLDDPNCMPARFSFLFSFLLIDGALEGYLALRRSERPFPAKRAVGLGAAFFGLSCVLFRTELPPYLAYETVLLDVLTFIFACGLLSPLSRRKLSRGAAVLLCLCQAGGLMLNAYFCITRCDAVDEMRASAYRETVTAVSGQVARLQAVDDGLYRMEKNFSRSENDPLLYGYNGLSHYSSDLKLQFNRFAARLGLEHSYFRITCSNGSTPVLNSLFGVKYLLWQEGRSLAEAPEGYVPLWTDGDVTAYENPKAMPLAYFAHIEQTADPLATENPFENQNALLTDLIGAPVMVFTPIEAEASADGDGLRYAFTIEAGEKLYLHTTGSYFYWNDGDAESRLRFEGCTALPVSAQTQACTLRVLHSEGVEPAFYLYRFDPEAWEAAWSTISANACTVMARTDSQLSLDVTVPEGGRQLLLTLPWDAGWQAVADGEKLPIEKRYDTLMALTLPEGAHQVTLRFIPQGLIPGAMISLLCLLGALGWAYADARRSRSTAKPSLRRQA